MNYLTFIYRYLGRFAEIAKYMVILDHQLSKSLEDNYLTRQEAARIGYACEEVYRQVHGLPPIEDKEDEDVST